MVTVAIPVRNGGALLREVLRMVSIQDVDHEVIVCDSGSTDGSPQAARAAGAEVLTIAPERFSHGGTRNLLMERAHGDHVAFLTQDAVPAHAGWLAELLAPFGDRADLALSFGPYVPRRGASPMVARELEEWFASFSPGGSVRVDRLAPEERRLPARSLHGHRGFFTDANGCVARAAWAEVPFRAVPYAEDHVLAHDMLRAGFAKAFVPGAAVVHSHQYSGWDWLRRSFDEARAVHEIYGIDELGRPTTVLRRVRGGVGGDLRWARTHDVPGGPGLAATSLWHHAMRGAGAMLGVRAGVLTPALSRRLSLEGR